MPPPRGLDLRTERDAPAVRNPAPGGEATPVDPLDHRPLVHAQPLGDVPHGQLARQEELGRADSVVVAHRGHGVAVERPPRAGAEAGGVQLGGQRGVVHGGADPAGEFDRGVVGPSELDDRHAPGDDHLLAGAGVPADADAGLGQVGLGQESDIGDERAQQPLAVSVCRRRRLPQLGDIGRQRLELSARRQGRGRRLRLGQRLLRLGHRHQRASQRDSRLRATRRFSCAQAWKARSARSAS